LTTIEAIAVGAALVAVVVAAILVSELRSRHQKKDQPPS
jgi:hypothetical protein